MKWTYNDIQQFIQAKDFIDTAVLPLVPFSVETDEDLRKYTFQAEAMFILMSQIEKQFKGRVLLLPAYHYMKQSTLDEEVERLKNTVDTLINQQPFKHVMLFTFDNKWRKHHNELNSELIWLPAPTENDLNQIETQQMIQSHANELKTLIKDQWH